MADSFGPPIWSQSMNNQQNGTPPLLTRSSRAANPTDTSALTPQVESVFSVNSPPKPAHSFLPRASAIGSNGNSNDGSRDDGVPVVYTKKSQARGWVEGGYTLQIVVKRAINVGTEVAAPDPYIRLFLGSADETECAVKAGTRVTYRNRNPYFEETFTFSLKGQPYDDAYLTCNVLHDEPFFKDVCLGQFQSRLSMLLGSLAAVGVPLTDKYPLTNRNGDLIAGEVEMQFTVLPPTAKLQDTMPGSEVYSQANLNQRFSSRSLELDVRAIHGLKTVADDDTINRVLNDLKIEIRVGTVSVREDVKAEMVAVPATATRFSSTSLKLDKKIIVPLDSAFAIASSMLNQFRTQLAMELGDVRIYLMNGNVSVCKAQFPLWTLDEQKPPAQGVKSAGGEAGAADVTATLAVEAAAGKATDAPAADTIKPMRLPMERYGKALVLPVELECAMQLISTSKVVPGAEAPVLHALAAEDEEDVASAPPLDPALIPAPLPTMMLDEQVEAGPCRLYAALVSSDSTFMKRIWESEGLTEVVVPEWSGEAGCTRTITYVRKLNIPMGPKSCNVKENHKLVAKQPGGWVLEIEISTTAPKGDLFVVKQQVIVQKTSAPTTSNIRVSMMVDWIKPGGMLKGIIERSATGDSKAHWTLMLSSIRSLGAVTATAATVEDGEDVASAPPLDPALIPAPLPTVVLDEQFAVGPNRLYSTILGTQSPVMKRIWETEGMSDMVVPEFSNSVRTIKCVRKLNIPMGPKSCNVNEQQKLVAKQPGGWVLEVEITTTAPKGDLFVVKWQVVVQKTSSATTSHVRVSMMVDWIKSGGMLKGIIERSATADSKAHWALVADNLRTLTPVAGKAVSVTLTPVAVTAGTAAAPAQAGSMGLPSWLQRVVETVLGPFPVPVLLCMLGMLALIVIIFWRQVSALQASQGQALERSSVALERVAMALERMSSMPASGMECGGVPTMPQTEL